MLKLGDCSYIYILQFYNFENFTPGQFKGQSLFFFFFFCTPKLIYGNLRENDTADLIYFSRNPRKRGNDNLGNYKNIQPEIRQR